MEIKRDIYLNKLISKKHNGLVKVVTGVRRCGKSYLLFNLFRNHLAEERVADDHTMISSPMCRKVFMRNFGQRTAGIAN